MDHPPALSIAFMELMSMLRGRIYGKTRKEAETHVALGVKADKPETLGPHYAIICSRSHHML
jgi:hypothetical protein